MTKQGKSFTITINSTDPIWIYCPEDTHCEEGMVGVINAPYVFLLTIYHQLLTR
jgi:hypothetical protein